MLGGGPTSQHPRGLIPADSGRAALRCHALIMALSTIVVSFPPQKLRKKLPLPSINDSVFERSAIRLRVKKTRRTKSLRRRATASCLTIDERQPAAGLFINLKPRRGMPRAGSDSVKRRGSMLVRKITGMVWGRLLEGEADHCSLWVRD